MSIKYTTYYFLLYFCINPQKQKLYDLPTIYRTFLAGYFLNILVGKQLTQKEMDEFLIRFHCRIYFDNESFVEEGKICSEIGILFSGFFKTTSSVNADPKRIINLHFDPYNIVIANWDSFIARQPALSSIVSIKESVLLYINEQDFNYLCNNFSLFATISRTMMNSAARASNQMAVDYKGLDAFASRMKFETENPQLINLLTLRELGFFLGFSKNTFKK